MKKQKLYLDFLFPSLNEYIGAMNRNRFIGNKMKQEFTDSVYYACKEQKLNPYSRAVELKFTYYEAHNRRDPDNIVAFAKKAILDGMVNAGILPDDTQKYIKKFTDEWVVDNKNTGVLVQIKEWQNDNTTTKLAGS